MCQTIPYIGASQGKDDGMRIFLIAMLVLVGLTAKAQSCSAPKPLTTEQVSMVSGQWTGSYEIRGKKTEFTVAVGSPEINHFTSITSPPMAGDELGETYRFCGSGAFHFRKNLAEGYYEFDAVPVGGGMKGTLVVESNGVRTTGTFELVRERIN